MKDELSARGLPCRVGQLPPTEVERTDNFETLMTHYLCHDHTKEATFDPVENDHFYIAVGELTGVREHDDGTWEAFAFEWYMNDDWTLNPRRGWFNYYDRLYPERGSFAVLKHEYEGLLPSEFEQTCNK